MHTPEATVEAWRNLWFHTGDAGWRDDDGYFFILDRIKDRIRRRAENISSYEIEAAALQLTGVREAAAVGVPSGMEGDDDIKLCVALDRAFEPADILAFLAARLPHFMVPRYIEIMPSLPRTPTNKLKKRELRDGGVGVHTWDRHQVGIRLKQLVQERSAKRT
jgi:carnitine-CoA ligase